MPEKKLRFHTMVFQYESAAFTLSDDKTIS